MNNMAVVLTGNKTFRLPAETIEALERLAELTGRSQTTLITTLVRHFEASVLKPLGPEELQAYREGELNFADMKVIKRRAETVARAVEEPAYGAVA
jgi:predicted DNA-binding protein